MKKISAIFLYSLLFLVSCNNNNDSSNNESSPTFVDQTNYHIGGDETYDEPFVYKDSITFTYGNVTSNKTTLEYVYNPMLAPSSFFTTTQILNVNKDSFINTSAYKKNVKTILYTPDFYFSYTNATSEYTQVVATYNETRECYVVEAIYDTDNVYIPLNGVVLAILKEISNPFKVGDVLKFSNTITRFQYGLVNQNDVRLGFNLFNEYRDEAEIIMYDSKYGNYTKTNANGCEMTLQYDFDKQSFIVKGFRGNNKENGNLVNDHLTYGSQIPKDGYVLSAHNKANNYQAYRQGRRFNLNDYLSFEGNDIYSSLKTTTLKKYALNNPTRRMDNIINYYDHSGNSLDEYGYTNQNLWGAKEIAVSKLNDEYGIVTAIDREVGCPSNGYILSANGDAAKELEMYCEIGTLITLGNDSVTINNDFGTKELYQLKYYQTILDDKNTLGQNKLYDYDFTNLKLNYDKLVNNIKEIENLLNKLEDSATGSDEIEKCKIQIKQLAIDGQNYYNLAYCAASESNYISTRAAWLWATNTHSLKEVQDLINHYANCNVNLIYLCVFDGKTTFKSDYVPYDNSFSGNFGEYGTDNFLGAFIGEAHKKGIEVHGWTTNFHVGNVGETNTLFNAHPEWQQVYYDGKVDSDDEMTEQTLLYFDQANPEVQQFLIDFYNEMLSKNDLDGLHIDYIRYAAGNDVGHKDSVYCAIDSNQKLYAQNCLNRTSGYTTYAMNDFKEKYHLTGDVKELVKDVPTYLLWSEYRTNRVSDFVRKLHNEVAIKNDIMLSMAIVPEVEFAKANKMQDWTLWIKEDLVDTINGMYYSSDVNRTAIEYEKAKEDFRGKLYEYPGILAASYFDLPQINNIYYYENAMNLATMGASIFDANAIWSPQRIIYSDANLDTENLLKIGLHRNKAVVAHSSLDVLLTNFINNISDRCDNLYIKNNLMSASQKESLINKLNSFSKTSPTELKNSLLDLKNSLNQYVSGEALNRISDYIDILVNLCSIKEYQA